MGILNEKELLSLCYGWSFGYIGGLLALGISYVLLIQPENPINPLTGHFLDKSTGEHIRIINILIAVWFAVFSIPTFLFVKDSKKPKRIDSALISNSFKSLLKTFKEMKKYKQILKFLIARLVYNDALITIFAFGGIYAKEVFDFTFNDIFLFGIVLNITAGLGAFLLGLLDDLVGGKKTIQISNIGFILACTLAVIAPSLDGSIIEGRTIFWIAGILIGICQVGVSHLSGNFISQEKIILTGCPVLYGFSKDPGNNSRFTRKAKTEKRKVVFTLHKNLRWDRR